jgi:serine/threonine protein kinase
MSDTEVYACFRDLLESLRLLHTQCKLVHGDIKPANIRFSKAEGASFIDFGSAHQLGTKHMAQTTASPIYMPPEVILGKADSHTQASDMYALALVTYQLIQQAFPFDKERVCVNEAMFKDAVKCGSRETVPNITTSEKGLKKVLQRVLHKMLHDQPSVRYGSVEKVLDDLDDLDVSTI